MSAPAFGYPPARMSAKHAAYYLGIGESTLWDRVKAGDYPLPVKERGMTFWLRKDLDAYIEARHNGGGAGSRQVMSLEDAIRAS